MVSGRQFEQCTASPPDQGFPLLESYLTGFDRIGMFFFILFSAAVVVLGGLSFRGKRFWLGWELLLQLGLEVTLAVLCSVVVQYQGCGQWEAAAQAAHS